MRKDDFEKAIDSLEEVKDAFRSTPNTGDLAPMENILLNKINNAGIVLTETYESQWGKYTPKMYR